MTRADPLPGGAGRPKFTSAGDGHYLYLQTQFGEDRCTQFRVIVLTDPPTPTHTHPSANKQTGPIKYTAPQLARSVTKIHVEVRVLQYLPLPALAGRPKFNQLEMTYKPRLVRIDARNFELSW